ncbi:DUF4162 domain-containing protein [Haladaptatus sp. W1]|nr:DUF4162 domain-containing protein [Haladaptatus sp. W1]
MNDGELVAQNTVERLRELTGSRSQLLLSVERVPTGLDLTAIDGVSEVSVEESMLRVSFSDPVTKPQVVKRVDAATTVTDIKSEEASLEELFTTYTTGDEPEDDPDARMEVTA